VRIFQNKKTRKFMKKMKIKSDSMKHAAALLKRPLAEIKQAKRLGCPAFHGGRVDVAALKKWLDARPKNAPGTTADKEPIQFGPEAAHRRVAVMEGLAFADLERALASGDLVTINAAREQWLELSDALRKYDGKVEAQVQTIPVETVEETIFCLVHWWKVTLYQQLTEKSSLAGIAPEHFELLKWATEKSLFAAITAVEGWMGKTKADPSVLAAARRALTQHGYFKWADDDFQQATEAFRQCFEDIAKATT
jgi:hypothetical protein